MAVIKFSGFKHGYPARAIHEFLRANPGPQTREAIINGAQITLTTAMDNHLSYWVRKGAYIREDGREPKWHVNPHAIFDPREYAE